MTRYFVPLVLLSACATATLVNVYKEKIYVDAGTGDLPTGYYDISCDQYYTENDPTALASTGPIPVRPSYYSARCSVRIQGRTYTCFKKSYDVDPINVSLMTLGCSTFIREWTEPKQSSDDGGYSPP